VPVVADLSMTWTVRAGFADIHVADLQAEASAAASYVTGAPEDFLTAVRSLLHGDTGTTVEFEAEPTVYRWHFNRTGRIVEVQLSEHARRGRPGTVIWSTSQPLDILARVTIRCFDAVAQQGEAEYEREWHHLFPRLELEALRTAWRR
jgi:hypothetical protein